MSGPWRKIIGPAKKRANDYLTELNVKPIEPTIDAQKTANENYNALETLLQRTQYEMERLSNVTLLLDETNNKWADYLARLDDDHQAAEQKIYDQFDDENTGFIAVMDKAREAVDVLRAKRREIEAMKQRLTEIRTGPALVLNQAPQKVHYPKLEIPSFDGKIQDFPEYKQKFVAVVHNTNLAPVYKLTHLVNSLTGAAQAAVRGYAITNENYEIVWELLQKKFGNSNAIKHSLHCELKNIQMANDSTYAQRKTLDAVERICRQLEDQGENLNHPQTAMLIESKFPRSVLTELYREKGTTDPWDIATLREKLDRYITLREAVNKIISENTKGSERNQNQSNNNFNRRRLDEKSRSNIALAAVGAKSTGQRNEAYFKCYFCGGDHKGYECVEYETADERINRTNELRLCRLCLRGGHSQNDCGYRGSTRCFICKKPGHNPALCRRRAMVEQQDAYRGAGSTRNEKNANPVPEKPKVETRSDSKNKPKVKNSKTATAVVDDDDKESEDEIGAATVGSVNKESRTEVLLLAAKVTVFNLDNPTLNTVVTAFFDIGAHSTYATTELQQKLKLNPIEQTMMSVSTFNNEETKKFLSSKVRFGILLKNGEQKIIEANTTELITNGFRSVQLTSAEVEKLTNENSDVLQIKGTVSIPSLLIGSNYFYDMVDLKGVIRLPSGFSIVPSQCGDMLGGRGKISPEGMAEPISCAVTALVTEDLSIKNFYNLENIGINEDPIEDDGDRAMEQFMKTIRKEGKRLVVKYPAKYDTIDLPTNFGLCMGRLRSLYTKLEQEPEELKKYHAIIVDQEAKGIIERVPKETDSPVIHYTPHHDVNTPDKVTTRKRIVFDASAKTKNSNSLNDVLLPGKNLMPDLCGMLCRYRSYDIAILSDVEKAFLQLGLDTPDRDLTRFIWLEDPTKGITKENLVFYRFCRVTFGVVSSPFLLAAAIRYHLSLYNDPLAAEIMFNIYVDNVIMYAKSTAEAIEKCLKSREIFADIGMNLRAFVSNDPKFNEFVRDQLKDTAVCMTQKVLGITWHLEDDSLEIKFPDETSIERKWTKRTLLKSIAEKFDPLGVLCPLLLPSKMIYQGLWNKGYNWDDPLKSEDEAEWKAILSDWKNQCFRFPRKLMPLKASEPEVDDKEIHMFVDASVKAFAAVGYLKVGSGKNVSISLVMAKSRLNPKKTITIPRLELLAALIGVRLANFVKNELKMKFRKIVIWTDSSCVLKWIESNKEQPRFIANRLSEIRKNEGFEFRYVSTEENPADCASRGLTVTEFNEYTLWWHGPEWLKKEEEEWPQKLDLKKVVISLENDTTPEITSQVFYQASLANIDEKEKYEPPINFDRYSNFLKVLEVTIVVLKFVKRKLFSKVAIPKQLEWLTAISESSTGNATDYQIAEDLVIKMAQKTNPPSVIEKQQLQLYEDEIGIIRSKGRIEESEKSIESTDPIFLPRENRLTTLIVLYTHQKLMHAGIQQCLGELRQQYWIVKARSKIKKTIRKECYGCRKFQAVPFRRPEFPQIPRERLHRRTPFEVVGLDYLGPVSTLSQKSLEEATHHKSKKKPQKEEARRKNWILIVTCFVTRAVHLEVVSDMTSETFLNAMRRIIARRGRPKHILSDNATQFVLAAQTLEMAWNLIAKDENVKRYFATNKINWQFTTPRAPWKGGLYEKLIDLFKRSFRRAVGRKVLSFDQLLTLTNEIEAVLNSRPLTYIYDERNEIEVLRPIDLIQHKCLIGVPVLADDYDDRTYRPRNITSREELLEFFECSLKYIDKFWKYWIDQYVLSLRERYQNEHNGPRSQMSRTPVPNEIVLLKEDELPRGHWKLAKVISIRQSKDGEIRSATVETSNHRLLNRPLNHLFPLEIDSAENEKAEKVTITSASVRRGNEQRLLKTSTLDKAVVKRTFFLLMIVTTFCGISANTKCQLNQKLQRTHTQTCVSYGLAVMKTGQGGFCWSTLNCTKGHVQQIANFERNSYFLYQDPKMQTFCGTPCTCPKWSLSCSFYQGKYTANSTIQSEKTRSILKDEKPDVCSFTKTITCSEHPSLGEFTQVQLYDKSLHLVKSLQIVHREIISDDYDCVGEGRTTGTPLFCNEHECEVNGTKFCYYARNNIVLLSTESGDIPIQAWGTVTRQYFKKIALRETAKCYNCQFKCIEGGVEITSGDMDVIEICSNHHCNRISRPNPVEITIFSLETAISQHEVKVKMWKNGNLVVHLKKLCPAEPICQLIKCTICSQYLLNTHCAPKTIIFILLFLMYLLTMVFYLTMKLFSNSLKAVCCVIWKPVHCMKAIVKRIWTIVCYRMVKIFRRSDQENKTDEAVNKTKQSSSNILRYVPSGSAFAHSMVIMCLLLQADACSETSVLTANEHVCQIGKDGLQSCTFSETTLLNLHSEGQEICLILQNNHKQAIGNMKIVVQRIKAICRPKSEFFSRDYDLKTEAIKRCATRGSCTNEFCANIKVTDRIEELGDIANNHTGYSYCRESCGCLDCGCGFCSPGCQFYRNYAIPTSQTVYEFLSCPVWDYQVEISISIEMNDKQPSVHNFSIKQGKLHRHNNAKFTMLSISAPPIPILNSQFVTDGNHTVVIRTATENGAMLGTQTDLTCNSKEKAIAFDCQFPPHLCECNQVGNHLNCQCAQKSIVKLFEQKERLLPLTMSGIFLEMDKGQITTSLRNLASIQLQLTLENLKIVTKANSNYCTVTPKNLTGCYNCITGAQLHYQCKTDFETALAAIQCGNNNFVSICNVSNPEAKEILSFNKPLVKENCTVNCPGGSSYFNIQGQLDYVAAENLVRVNSSGKMAEITNGGWMNIPNPFEIFSLLPFNKFEKLSVLAIYVVSIILLLLFSPQICSVLCFLRKIHKTKIV